MKSTMLSAFLIAAIALGVVNGWMFLQQPGMTFFPDARLVATPTDWGLDYQDVELRSSDDLKLHGWFIPANSSERVLLFFHGNAGNISHRGDSIRIFHALGLNVFIPDYRGYGRSEGVPGEDGLYRDADAAWRYLTGERGYAPGQVVVFGRSLGGAVAAHLAAEVDPGALILESTLSSAKDFAADVFPLLSRLVVMRYRFDVIGALARVHCPVLVLHSEADEIMPYKLGRKLYRAANEPKVFVALRGDHNQGFLLSQPDYQQQLARFLDRYPGGARQPGSP